MKKYIFLIMIIVLSSLAYSFDWIEINNAGQEGNFSLKPNFFYRNYTVNNYDYFKWQVSHGYAPNEIYNITKLNLCPEVDNQLVTRMFSNDSISGKNESYVQCNNGTDWVTVGKPPSQPGGQSCSFVAGNGSSFLHDGNYATSSFYRSADGNWRIVAGGNNCPANLWEESLFYLQFKSVLYYSMFNYSESFSTITDNNYFQKNGTLNGYTFHPGIYEGLANNLSRVAGPPNISGSESMDFDGVNDYIDLGNDSSLKVTSSFTISVWVKPLINGVTTVIYGQNTGGGTGGIQLKQFSNGQISFAYNNGGAVACSSNIYTSIGVWDHLTVVHNGSNIEIYKNGVVGTMSGTCTGSIVYHPINPFTISSENGGSKFFNGSITGVNIFNKTLTESEILDLFQNSTKYGVPSNLRTDLLAQYTFNTDFDNITHVKDTNHLIESTNTTGGIDLGAAQYFDKVGDNILVSSTSISGFPFTQCGWFYPADNSGEKTIVSTVDVSNGGIYYTATTSGGFFRQEARNGANFGQQGGVVTADSWNHICSVFESDSSRSLYGNGIFISKQTDSVTFNANVDGHFIGIYRAAGTGPMEGAIDEVKIFEEALQDGQIQDLYNFNDAFYSTFEITINSPLENSVHALEDEEVVFNYNLTTTNAFPVNCSLIRNGIIINQSTNNLLTGNYELTDHNLVIDTSTRYQLLCNRSGLEETSNVTLVVRGSLFNVSITDPPTGTSVTGSPVNISYVVALNETPVLRVNCSLYRNSILRETQDILTPGTTYYFSDILSFNDTVNYNVTCVSEYRTNTSNTIALNVDTLIRLVPCGVESNETALNFTLRDSLNLSYVTGDIAGHYSVRQYDGTVFFQNLSSTGSINQTLCIFPENANTTFNAQIEYTGTGYDTFTYYFENAEVDNVMDQYSLYLTPSSNTTLVTFTVSDENDDPVEGVLIQILKFDLSTNSSIISEVLTTDTDGEAVGNIILNTQRYRFLLIRNGRELLFTEPKILTLPIHGFRVNLNVDYFTNYNKYRDTLCSLTFTNATRTFRFDWIDTSSSVVEGCLRVNQISYLGEVQLSDNCSTSTSGVLNKIVPPPTGEFTYIGIGYIRIGDSEFVCGDTISFKDDTRYKTFGTEGLLGSFFITITLVMVGIWSPLIAVAMMALGLYLSIILGIFQLSLPVLLPFIIATGVVMYKVSQQ